MQPGGRGPANPAGLAFYDRLVDELLAQGIDPWVTLYHWDLPQELEDAGGWPARDTAYRFADYAMLVFDALSDRVEHLDHAERAVVLGDARLRVRRARARARANFDDGHRRRAPPAARPRPGDPADAGGGDRAPIELGITLNMGTADPATDSEADREAARRADGLGLRIYLDPLVHGRYPADMVADLAARGRRASRCRTATWRSSRPRSTCSGVNYYFGAGFSGVDERRRHRGRRRPARSSRAIPLGRPRTAMDWEIVPEGFTELLVRLQPRLPGPADGDHRERRRLRRRARRDGFVARRRPDRVPGHAPRARSPRPGSRAPTCAATSPGR